MSQFFKRKNSLGILYLNHQKAELDEVLEVSKKINLPIRDVYGVQQVGPSKVIVKLMDNASDMFEKTMKTYESQVLALQTRNVSVQIINLSLNKVVVTLRNVPFEFPDYVLNSILSEYGHVYNIRTQTYMQGPLKGITNGNKTALMTLRKPIPSSLVFEGVMFMVSYRGQPRTCLKCGISGHLAAQCGAMQWEVKNRLNEADFPELKRRDEVPAENPDNEKSTGNGNGNDVAVDTTADISDPDKCPDDETENAVPVVNESEKGKIPEECGTAQQNEPPALGASGVQERESSNINSNPDGFHMSMAVAQIHAEKEINVDSQESNNNETENVSMEPLKVTNSGNFTDSEITETLSSTMIIPDDVSLEIPVNDSEIDNSQKDMFEGMEKMDEEAVAGKLGEINISEDITDLETKETPDTSFCEEQEIRLNKENPWRQVLRKNKKETVGQKVYPVRKKMKEMGKVSSTESQRSHVKRKHASVEMLVNDTVNLSKGKDKVSIGSKKYGNE